MGHMISQKSIGYTTERQDSSSLVNGRRQAGYLEASENKGFDDPGILQELPLVNKIRKRGEDWVAKGYPGTTGVTRKLLEYWSDNGEKGQQIFLMPSLKELYGP